MRIVIEKLFGRLAKTIVNHAVFVIIGMMTLIVLLSLPLANMDVDASIEYYLKDDDSYLIAYKQFKKLFGSDERIVIGIRSPDIFSESFFERLRALHETLESDVPYVQKINSIITAPIFEENQNRIAVNTLLDSWPETPEAFRSALNLIRSAPLYRNRFYTNDESFAIVTLSIDSDRADTGTQLTEDILSVFETDISESPTGRNVENEAISLNRKEVKQLVNAVYNVVSRHQHKDFQIYPTGLPMYRQFIGKMIRHDTIFFIGLSSITIALILFLLLRRLSGVILPFIVVLGSVGSTMGLMAFFNRPLKTPTTILPSFLMAVGVGASVHVMTLFDVV